jgi:peptide/nickel transport system substrate-binding protein
VAPSRQPLDPAVGTRPAALEALWLAYTPPLTYKRAEGKNGIQLIPGLAEQLPTVSQGGRVYNFKLRRGLRYSDGTPVRASDFAHSVRRATTLSPVARRLFDDVGAIDARDATGAVVVRLLRPDPAFPYALASSFAGLVPGRTPAHAARRRPPPGLGPYELVASTPDGGFTLRRNRRFRLPGIPGGNLDEITARPFADAGAAAREVIAGRIDYMQETPPFALLPDLRSKYSDRYAQYPSLNTRYLQLLTRPPLDRRRIRQAIAYAIDEGKIARLSHGLVQPTCNLLPPELPGYRKLSPCPWGNPSGSPDLVKARALAEGSPGSGPVTILAPRGERVVGSYFARMLRTLGLGARLRFVGGRPGLPGPGGEAAVAVLSPVVPDAAAAMTGLTAGDGAPPTSLRSLDPRLAELAVRAREQPDQARRAALAAELDRALVRGAIALPYGAELRTIFVSERLDLANCARFHPLYGNDYSSFCLK